MNKKETWIYSHYVENGLDSDTAQIVIEANRIVNQEGAYRAWRKQHPEETNKKAGEHHSKVNSPNEAQRDCYAIAKQLREDQEPNQTMF